MASISVVLVQSFVDYMQAALVCPEIPQEGEIDLEGLARAVEGRAELREVIEIPALRLNALDGIDTTVVAFTTDIPAFGGQWGEPFLIGPGSIHVAHTLEERVPKSELLDPGVSGFRSRISVGVRPSDFRISNPSANSMT